MSTAVYGTTQRVSVTQPPVFAEDLETAIQGTLAKLAEVERDYETRRDALNKWSGSIGQKKRLRENLESLHQRRREPIVLELANLHYRMMRATIFGSLAKPVPSVSALRAFRV
jgi:hypothetical protein